MPDFPDSLNKKNSILLSRNAPVALVVGVSSFLGSHIAEKLLEKNVQVVGIDEVLSSEKDNLENLVKDKNFHLVSRQITSDNFLDEDSFLELSRIDYAFFVGVPEKDKHKLSKGVKIFLSYIRQNAELFSNEENKKARIKELPHLEKPRLVFLSSVALYNNELTPEVGLLKEAESYFAKGIKQLRLNGRVVRLGNIYGPRMEINDRNRLTRLLLASLNDELEEEQTSNTFTTRDLYIDDAVALILKSVLSGGTANKIFDGVLIHPYKLSEIKQILLDPLWFESNQASPTTLPPWPTPNLLRTVKELAWKPKTNLFESLKKTLVYLKQHHSQLQEQEIAPDYKTSKKWSFADYDEKVYRDREERGDQEVINKESREDRGQKTPSKGRLNNIAGRFVSLVIVAIIVLGIFFPIGSLAFGGLNIRNNLVASRASLEVGEFDKASSQIIQAKSTIQDLEGLLESAKILKRLNLMTEQINTFELLLSSAEEGIDGAHHAVEGSKALFQTTKVISGESNEDPSELYQKAQTELTIAEQKTAKLTADLSDESFTAGFPSLIKNRITDTLVKLNAYSSLISQARTAAYLMPEITAVNGKKSYLVLLQNNLELRPTGGFIGSYAKFDFEAGKLAAIKVDDIYNLDGALKDVIEPPSELKSDLGVTRWYLRDSNFDPDFPTSARQADFFFKKEAGENVNGVIALDLAASGNLLNAVGGLDLPEYGEAVDGDNLFERAISHAEVGFFPGSQAKKNYLTALQTQLFNKIFYLSKQNWPAIIKALGESLEQKHILVYLFDPGAFSYLASSNWSGVMPRAAEAKEGESNDFLAAIEANLGANKSNYFLERKYNLETQISKEGQISHNLRINYKNNSPSEVFPAGRYKNRLRLYVPLGARLVKASFGEQDLTSKVTNFSDYGRSGFSMLLELLPKEQKTLTIEYVLATPLSFKENQTAYKMEVFKQPGTNKDPFEWNLTYPINLKLETNSTSGESSQQEINFSTDLNKDRVFLLNFLLK